MRKVIVSMPLEHRVVLFTYQPGAGTEWAAAARYNSAA